MRPIYLALLPAAALLTACGTDESSPRLDFVADGRTLTADRTAAAADTFEVRAFAESRDKEPRLKRFSVSVQYTYYASPDQGLIEEPTRPFFDTVFTNAPSAYLFVNRFGAGTDSGRELWTYTTEDEQGRSATRRLRLSVRQADSLRDWHSYSVQLQAPRTRSSRSALGALRGFVLPSYATAAPAFQQLTDIVYVPGSTGPRLAAPSAAMAATVPNLGVSRWTQRRATGLVLTTITRAAFDAINSSVAIGEAVSNAGTLGEITAPVAKDKVVAFRTADGRNGLLLVNAVSSAAPVDLQLSVKVQRR